MVKRCPNCDSPKGKPCPRWRDQWTDMQGNTLMERNDLSGAMRPLSGCFYDVTVRMLLEMTRHVMGAQAAIESTRNVIYTGFGHVADVLSLERSTEEKKLLNGPK